MALACCRGLTQARSRAHERQLERTGMIIADGRPRSTRCVVVSALGAWHGGFAAGPLLAAIPQVCFSDDCQAQVDRVFAAAVGVPLLVFVVSVALIVTGKPEEKEGSFRDPETGAVFEAAEGASPERDTKGELAFRPVGYTPWPVEEGAPGERIRVDVGTVGAVAPRTFVFERTLPQPSELVCATLPRPLGVVFEEDTRAECARVAAIVPGTAADRQQGRARLDRTQRKSCVMEGDVLRAITCTTLVYPTDSLFGAKPARRTVTLFGADGQSWGKVAGALKRGLVEDGPVTVILERRLKEDGEPYYASEELVGGQGGQEAGMEEGGARVAAEPKSKDAGKERSAWDMLK